MSNMNWVSLLNSGLASQVSAGSALQNSVTLTDISGGGNVAGQAITLPASFLTAGTQIRFTANGILSNTGTPNLTLGLFYGGVAGTALATTGAVATLTGLSSGTWELRALARVDATGTSGSIRTIGSVLGPFASAVMLPATSASGNNVTVATGTANILTVGAQWGTASASNTITCYQFSVELLN